MPPRSAPTTNVTVNGAALREIRIRSGVSVAALATEVGVSRSYLTKIELELGGRRQVSPHVYSALLRALSIKDRRALLAESATAVA